MWVKRVRFPLVGLVVGLTLGAGLSAGGSGEAHALGESRGVGSGLSKAGNGKPLLPEGSWLPEGAWVSGTGSAAGETLAASLGGSYSVSALGQATYSVPLVFPAGRMGVEPSLGLRYSGEGNGIVGAGWSLSGAMSSITRCGKSLWTEGYVGGVGFRDAGAVSEEWGDVSASDRFCLDGQRLVAVSGQYGADTTEYRTEQESFSKIVSHTSSAQGPDRFVVTTRGGETLTYSWNPGGTTPLTGKQYEATETGLTAVGEKRVLWALARVEDRFGNFMEVDYRVKRHPGTGVEQAEAVEILTKRFRYTGNTSAQSGSVRDPLWGSVRDPQRVVELVYEDEEGDSKKQRPDVQERWLAGVKGINTQRLVAITAKVKRTLGGALEPVWTYGLTYRDPGVGSLGRSLLTSVQRCATAPDWTPTNRKVVAGSCVEKKEFAWTEASEVPTFSGQKVADVKLTLSCEGSLSGQPYSDGYVHPYYRPPYLPAVTAVDIDGDALDDVVVQQGGCPVVGEDIASADPNALVLRGQRVGNKVLPLAKASPLMGGASAFTKEYSVTGMSWMDMEGDGAVEGWATRVFSANIGNAANPTPVVRQFCEQTQLRWDDAAQVFKKVNSWPAYECDTLPDGALPEVEKLSGRDLIDKNRFAHVFADMNGDRLPELYMARARNYKLFTLSNNLDYGQIELPGPDGMRSTDGTAPWATVATLPGVFEAHQLRRSAVSGAMQPIPMGSTGLVGACALMTLDVDGDGKTELLVQNWGETLPFLSQPIHKLDLLDNIGGWKYGCDSSKMRVLRQREGVVQGQPAYVIEEDTQRKYPRIGRKSGILDPEPSWNEVASPTDKADPDSYASTSLTMIDVNQDGLLDALVVSNPIETTPGAPTRMAVRMNTGNGFTPPASLGDFPPLAKQARNQKGELLAGDFGPRVVDLNGDGRQDLLWIGQVKRKGDDYADSWTDELYALISNGNGSFNAVSMSSLDASYSANLPLGWMRGVRVPKEGFTTMRTLDANGDGKVDVASLWGDQLLLYTQTSPGLWNRLKWVKDEGRLPDVEFVYKRDWADKWSGGTGACALGKRCVRQQLSVVREVITRAHLKDVAYNPAKPEAWPAGNVIHHDYQELMADVGSGVMAFKKVRTFDALRHVETVAEYDLDTVIKVGGLERPVYPYANAPKRVTTTVPVYTGEQQAGAKPKPLNPTALVTRREALVTEVRPFTYTNSAIGETVTTWTILPRESRVRTWQQTVQVDLTLTASNNSSLDRLGGINEPASGFLSEQTTRQDYVPGTAYLNYAETATTGGETTTWLGTYYLDDKAKWLLGLLKEETISNKQANPQAGTALNFNRYSYDPDKGYLTKVEREPQASDPALRKVTEYTRSALGHVIRISETGMNSAQQLETRGINLSYDDAESYKPGQLNERIYLTRVWPDANPALSYSVARDPVWGVVVATQDGSGRYVQTTYDWAGRPVWSQAKVNDQNQVQSLPPTTWRYARRPDCQVNGVSYCSMGMIATSQAWTAAGQVESTSTVVADELGRPLSEQGTAFDGSLSEVRYGYNPYHQLEWSTLPFAMGQAMKKTLYQYDSLGRSTRVTLPDGASSTMTYALSTDPVIHRTTTRTDAVGNEKTTVTDIDGRLVRSIEFLKDAAGNAKPLITRYEYGPRGLLQREVDPKENKSYYEYDALGRLTLQKVVGGGFFQSAWTSFDELYSSEHLETGEKTRSWLDGMGRVVKSLTTDKAGTPLFQQELTWDSAPNGLGQLHKAKAINGVAPLDPTHEVVQEYDRWGREVKSTQILGGKNYIHEAQYDADGRIRALLFPADQSQDQVKACYHYQATGYLAGVGEVTPATTECPLQAEGNGYASLWKVNQRDARGALLQGDLGNGVRTTRSYYPNTGQLREMVSTHLATQAKRFHLGYNYYPNGAVKDRIDYSAHNLQGKVTYTYDSLLRLIRADQESPLANDTTSRALYWTYDDLGNKLSKGESLYPKGSTAPLAPTTPLETNAFLDANRPHAITQHTNHDTGEVLAYGYDAMGRQTTAQVPGQAMIKRVQDYRAGGLLPRFLTYQTKPTEYVYGVNGQRAMKRNQNGEIAYLGLMEIHRSNGGERYVVSVPGIEGARTQIVIDTATHKREKRYVLQDVQGSSGVVLDGQGVEKERRYYDPFGQRLTADGTPYTPPPGQSLAYVGQLLAGYTEYEQEEDTGIINANGRLIAAENGLFMSLDPIHGGGQRANRYSYVMNSPPNRTDKSGYDCIGLECNTQVGSGVSVDPYGPGGQPYSGAFDNVPVTSNCAAGTYDLCGHSGTSGSSGSATASNGTAPKTNSVGGVQGAGAPNNPGTGSSTPTKSFAWGSFACGTNLDGTSVMCEQSPPLSSLPTTSERIKGGVTVVVGTGIKVGKPQVFRKVGRAIFENNVIKQPSLRRLVDRRIIKTAAKGTLPIRDMSSLWEDEYGKREPTARALAIMELLEDEQGKLDAELTQLVEQQKTTNPNDPSYKEIETALRAAEAQRDETMQAIEALRNWRQEHGYAPSPVNIGKRLVGFTLGSAITGVQNMVDLTGLPGLEVASPPLPVDIEVEGQDPSDYLQVEIK